MTNVLVQMCDEKKTTHYLYSSRASSSWTRNSYDDYTQNTEKQIDLYHCNTALTTIVI